MRTYRITETQNAQSGRAATTIKAANLIAAKRAATRAQIFQGTVLMVSTANGAPLAIKENGKWVYVE